MKRYLVAIYLRLSKEDDKWKEESNSIAMQRILLRRYIEENFADYEIIEFCDDGYTGTNFDRPGMQEMLERIRNGEINCVIVKDFSRFARDYIELAPTLSRFSHSLASVLYPLMTGMTAPKFREALLTLT